MTKKDYVLILGANSDIARALAQQYAAAGYNIYLASRGDLSADAIDLQIRYQVIAKWLAFDALDFASHANFLASLDPYPIGVVVAWGYLGTPGLAVNDFNEARKIIDSNYTSCVSVLDLVAAIFKQRGNGFIVGISSVAGDRGRASNYHYGSSKAAFTAYLSGLRAALSYFNVQVLTVNPGFVATKLIAHMKTPNLITGKPQAVARDIFVAQQRGKDILYTPWYWRYIMGVVKLIPEKIFKRSKF